MIIYQKIFLTFEKHNKKVYNNVRVKEMKKVILSLIVGFTLIFLSGCGIFNLNGWILPDDGEFLACIEKLDTPQKIGNYMLENFTYKVHDFTAQSPYELFLSKKGDCDEFAKFGVFIADYHGYETFIIHIFDNSLYSHMVAVYNEDIWYSFTNSRYYRCGFDDFREIVEYVYHITDRNWRKYKVYNYWNDVIEIGYNN